MLVTISKLADLAPLVCRWTSSVTSLSVPRHRHIRHMMVLRSELGCLLQASLSLPGSPFTLRRGSKSSQFGWRKAKQHPHGPRSGDRQPLVLPYLDNLNLPYADDSNAVTPTSDELCNSQNTHGFLASRRRLSSASYASRISGHGYDAPSGKFVPGSRRSSFASYASRISGHGDYSLKGKERNREPTHFHWNTSIKTRAPLLPEVVVDKTKSDDNVRRQYDVREQFPLFPVDSSLVGDAANLNWARLCGSLGWTPFGHVIHSPRNSGSLKIVKVKICTFHVVDMAHTRIAVWGRLAQCTAVVTRGHCELKELLLVRKSKCRNTNYQSSVKYSDGNGQYNDPIFVLVVEHKELLTFLWQWRFFLFRAKTANNTGSISNTSTTECIECSPILLLFHLDFLQ